MMFILPALLWAMSLVLFLTYPENEEQDGAALLDFLVALVV